MTRSTSLFVLLSLVACDSADEADAKVTKAAAAPAEAAQGQPVADEAKTDEAKADEAKTDEPAAADEADEPADADAAVEPAATDATKQRDELMADVAAKAKAHEYDELEALMGDDFHFAHGEASESEQPGSVALAAWREHPDQLDELAAFVEGGCAASPGDETEYVCPAELAESEEFGNAAYALFEADDDGTWTWTRFVTSVGPVPDEAAAAAAGKGKGKDASARKGRSKTAAKGKGKEKDAAGKDATTGRRKGKIGIPACDRYLRKYKRCLKQHAPKETRKMLLKTVAQTAKGWKAAVEAGSGKQLAATCKAANDAAKKTMKAWGCKW